MTAPHTAPASDPDGSTPDAIMARILDVQRTRHDLEREPLGWSSPEARARLRDLRTKEDKLWRDWALARQRTAGTP